MVTCKHAKIGKISFKNTEKVAHINCSDKLELEDIMMTPCNGRGIQLTYISVGGLLLQPLLTLDLIQKKIEFYTLLFLIG